MWVVVTKTEESVEGLVDKQAAGFKMGFHGLCCVQIAV